jgi:lysylphosphatidylglycerol synthetase-like protein (DUF2156 family)
MSGAPDQLPAARRHGASALAYATLDPRLDIHTVDGIDGYIAYKRSGKTMVAVCSPVCAPEDHDALVDSFREDGKRRRCRTAFFGATAPLAAPLERLGYRRYRAARDSWVDLEDFTTRGNRMLNVRRGYNHARNIGMTWEEYLPWAGRDKELEGTCDGISREWLEDKGGLELQFILGQADWDVPGERRFFIARTKERVDGFLVYHPVFHEKAWYLDMSRRRNDAPNGAMDFLLVETMKLFRSEGAEKVYMGMIPELDFHRELNGSGPAVRTMVRAFASQSELFYPVKTETFFKKKFQPVWEDLYLCVDRRITMSILHDLLKAFQPAGMRGIIGKKLFG